VRHEDDNPVVEEFWFAAQASSDRGFWHGTALATTTQFLVAYFRLLSQVVVV